MATATRRRRTAVVDDDTPDPTAATEQTEDALEGREPRAQRAPEARLSRKNPRTQTWGLLYRGTPELVTQTWVQEVCGGGEYKIEIYGSREDGSFGYLKNRLELFSVDEALPFKGAPHAITVAAAPASMQVSRRDDGDDSDTRFLMKTQMMEMMKDQNESRNQTSMMMMQMMKMMADSAATNMQAMTAMISAMTSRQPADTGTRDMLAALLPALVSKKDPTEIAAQLIALMKPSGGAGLGELGGIEGLLDLADRLNKRGNGESEDSIAGVLKENLPAAIEVAGKFADRAARPNPAHRIVTPGPPRPAIAPGRVVQPDHIREVAPATVVEPAQVQDEWTHLEGAMAQLAGFAQAGKDPYQVVQTALLFATDEQKGSLREMIVKPDIAKQIVARFPVFQAYPAWLESFLAELHEEFFPSPDEPDDAPDDTDKEPTA